MEANSNDSLFRKKILDLLSKEEEALFDNQFSENPDFQEEFHAYKEVFETVIVAENKELKKQLEHLVGPKKRTFGSWLPMAASFAVLLGVAAFLYVSGKGNVYDTYFDTYPNVVLPTTRGDQGSGDILEKAFFHYDQAQFEEATKAFDTYLEGNEDRTVMLYSAVALMHLNESDQAKERLELLLNTANDFEFTAEARWYLALLYLKKDNIPKAKALLESNRKEGLAFKAAEIDELLQLLGESNESH
ncbi:hypothetical protein ABV409_02910 [Flagellimonas sp. DF-77]|uniref:tetratricopeptide repeat protein n=1 Tax=Flagellimonas algarum TaxID=3230298 RepID=UPI0033982120